MAPLIDVRPFGRGTTARTKEKGAELFYIAPNLSRSAARPNHEIEVQTPRQPVNPHTRAVRQPRFAAATDGRQLVSLIAGSELCRAVIAAEAAGSAAHFPAKYLAKIARRSESDLFGDRCQREIRVDEQLLSAGETCPQEFLFGRSSEEFEKTTFERAARDVQRASQIGHGDVVGGAEADESQGGGYLWIGDRDEIARLADDEAARGKLDNSFGRFFARHQPVEQSSGLVADAFGADVDTAERRI